MEHQPGETTTAGSGCHPTYTIPPLTPSPVKGNQEAFNAPGIPSVPALPLGTSNGGGLTPAEPAFLASELPEGGLSYGHHCNNWLSTIADGFNGANDAAVVPYPRDIPVNWSTSQLSYAFTPKILSEQEAPSERLAAPSFWLQPQVSYPTTPYTDNPSSFFPGYPNPTPEVEADLGKRRDTSSFDASYLHPRSDLTYPSTGPAAQRQLNANHLFSPVPAYCHGPHHRLPVIPNEQSNNSHAVPQHRYEQHTAATPETRPTATNLASPAPSGVQLDTPIILPKKRRGRPPKHDVTFPRQSSTLSTSSSVLSPATTKVSSCSSFDTAATNATTVDESPGSSSSSFSSSSSQPQGGDQGDDDASQPNKRRARGGSRSNINNNSSSSYGEGTNLSPRSRNRLAAIRYRVKTQAAAAQLEAEEQEVSQMRNSLLTSHGLLKEEVYNLKNEVLRHAGCDCPFIQAYLARAAQQVYSGLRQGLSLPQLPPPPPVTKGMMVCGHEHGDGQTGQQDHEEEHSGDGNATSSTTAGTTTSDEDRGASMGW